MLKMYVGYWDETSAFIAIWYAGSYGTVFHYEQFVTIFFHI